MTARAFIGFVFANQKGSGPCVPEFATLVLSAKKTGSRVLEVATLVFSRSQV